MGLSIAVFVSLAPLPQATRSDPVPCYHSLSPPANWAHTPVILGVKLNTKIAGLSYPSPSDCDLLAFPLTMPDHLLHAATQYEATSFLEHQV